MDPISIALGVAQFAPTVIKWLAGDKAGEAAEKIVGMAEQVTGRRGKEAVDALAADPALVLQFRSRLLDVEAELDKAFLKDRQDARARDVAIQKGGRRNYRADIMVIMAAVGLIVCLVVVTMAGPNITGEAIGVIATIAGLFGACLKDSFSFEFGSSRSSRNKDDLLQKLAAGE